MTGLDNQRSILNADADREFGNGKRFTAPAAKFFVLSACGVERDVLLEKYDPTYDIFSARPTVR